MLSFDAREWADEFVRLNPGSDGELMLAWFANALMRGFDEHAWRRPLADRLALLRDMTGDPTVHAAPFVTHDTIDGEMRQVVWWRVCRFVATPDDPWSIGFVVHFEFPERGGGGTYLAGPTEIDAINAAVGHFDRKGVVSADEDSGSV